MKINFFDLVVFELDWRAVTAVCVAVVAVVVITKLF